MSGSAFAYRQFHNQPAGSPLDRSLTELWATVRQETGGKLDVNVCPRNDGIPGGDPQALAMLRAGEVEFYVLMGGLLGAVAPVAEITGLPFAFASYARVFAAIDGALGDHIRQELLAKGIYAVPRACFDNGFRHITARARPIRTADDLVGLKIRTPAGRLFIDFFESLGARPAPINLNKLYDALKAGTVEAQENPLAMVEVNRLYEVQTYLSFTDHMWSGFNLLANADRWRALPADVREAVERVAPRYAARQREDNAAFNAALRTRLAERGMIVNEADRASIRARLGPFYARWKREFGAAAWGLLEADVGPLG
ncbi:MAG: TRAP transporter substrate-binding protein [Candidatus Rokubacteria bacterium]|nr:TRAP transporter substrate-binding protein [Candidatus Rokubacteria bacterium]